MVKIEPIDAQFRKIKKKFESDPKDWRVLSDIDPKGNKDLFINQRDELWQIKTKPLSPVTGIASSCHVRNLDDEIQEEINTRGIEGNKFLFSMVVPQKDESAILASGVESFAKARTKRLKEMISEKEKNIEKELTEDVEQEFEKKHPQRKNLFM